MIMHLNTKAVIYYTKAPCCLLMRFQAICVWISLVIEKRSLLYENRKTITIKKLLFVACPLGVD